MSLRNTVLAAIAGGLAAVAALSPAHAGIKTESFEYKDGDTVLEGFIAYDDATTAKRPGVLIWPSWVGPTDHERDAAKKLAEMGYVAFVADPYGKGVRPTPPKESAAEMGKYMSNRPMLRRNLSATAFDTVTIDAELVARRSRGRRPVRSTSASSAGCSSPPATTAVLGGRRSSRCVRQPRTTNRLPFVSWSVSWSTMTSL